MATQSTDVVDAQQEVGRLFFHTGKVALCKADVAAFYIWIVESLADIFTNISLSLFKMQSEDYIYTS